MITINLLFFKIFKRFKNFFFRKLIISQLNIAMLLHYDSSPYLDHTCRMSIRQHIRRYRFRFLDNTHRIRCSGYCISDHSVCQTNHIYIDILNEISNTIWDHKKSVNYKEIHTHNVLFKKLSHKHCLKQGSNMSIRYTNLQDKLLHHDCLIHKHMSRPADGIHSLRIPKNCTVYKVYRNSRKDILIKG